MKNKIEEFLENLSKPQVEDIPFQKAFKLALLNSKKSARIGILFIALPLLVLILAIFLPLFNLRFGSSNFFNNLTSHLSAYAKATIFFTLTVGFPLIAVALNILSITFFNYDSRKKELNMSFKLKWWNIMITLIAGLLASFFLFHFIADSLAGK